MKFGQSAAGNLSNQEPTTENFRQALCGGLRRSQKELPCKFFYDAEGSLLFDRICALEDYYLARAETAILEERIEEMAGWIGPDSLLMELGSGTSRKTRLLLDHLRTPAGYVPVDISRDQLLDSAKQLEHRYPGLPISPVCADYTRPFELPPFHKPVTRVFVFFPGSTVGNFEPTEAERFLGRIARISRGGFLIIGFDLRKDPTIHEKAYNDPEGVTAAFNRNILVRANRELGTDFKPEAFEHRAVFNRETGRIEMHLVSRERQRVHLDGERFEFEPGESIVTEYSYKYTRDEFYQMTRRAGFQRERSWNDRREYFEVCLLKAGIHSGFRAVPYTSHSGLTRSKARRRRR